MAAGLAERSHYRIFLRDIAVDVACGLHPWERHPERPNRLIVNVEMFAPWPLGARDAFVDYDRVRAHVLGWAGRPHVELLETLLEGLADFILKDEQVAGCRISISKPDIFAETAGAGVELTRWREG